MSNIPKIRSSFQHCDDAQQQPDALKEQYKTYIAHIASNTKCVPKKHARQKSFRRRNRPPTIHGTIVCLCVRVQTCGKKILSKRVRTIHRIRICCQRRTNSQMMVSIKARVCCAQKGTRTRRGCLCGGLPAASGAFDDAVSHTERMKVSRVLSTAVRIALAPALH